METEKRFRQEWIDDGKPLTVLHTQADVIAELSAFLNPVDFVTIRDVIESMDVGSVLDLSNNLGSKWTVKRVR